MQAEINTTVVLTVTLPGMAADPRTMLQHASIGKLLAVGTAGLTVGAAVPMYQCMREPRKARALPAMQSMLMF